MCTRLGAGALSVQTAAGRAADMIRRMRVGIEIGQVQTEVADQARWAEDAGFDQVVTGEHLFFHGPTPNTLITLAAAAGATRNIRLLSALTIVPVYPLAVLAKLVASLDQVSNGRFDFGVGVGGEYPPEFEAAGVPVREREIGRASCRERV